MADRLVAAFVRELAALPDEELRPLAARLAPFLPEAGPAVAFLTVAEAAERLGVHSNTVYRMIETGRLRGVRAGRLWRIPETELGPVEPAAPPVGRVTRLAPPGRRGRRFGDLVRELPYAGPRP